VRNGKILICGAGVAGPALAYWLRRHGFEPVLIERAPALRRGGYIVDFWGLGFDIAEKMGLLPALRTNGYHIDEVRIVDGRGARTGGFKASALWSSLGDRYLSILRSDLSRLIFESLGGAVRSVFGETVTAIEQDEHSARVSFKSAPAERFDLVIGAGGLHSPVRTIMFGPESRYEKHLGYYAASFDVEGYPHRDPRAYVSYAAPGRQVSRYSMRGDRTVFFFVVTSSAPRTGALQDIAGQKEFLRRAFAQDSWECQAILQALDGCTDLYFDVVSQIHMDAWHRGRVALIGDACSCPSLLAGQGAALAIIGAYVLAGELKRAGGDYRTAYQNYEALLHPFVLDKQRAAERFAGSFAPKTEAGIFLRNQVTRLMSLPLIANLAMGRLLSDSLALPAYESH
jgi:2-polyprenyl-6-methoxyphenol hydroxylase-like FAD-dependent oxidoreductase